MLDQHHDHDLGLLHDLEVLQARAAQRRIALRWLVGAGGLVLVGCGGGGGDASTTAGGTDSTGTTTGSTGGSGSTGSSDSTKSCSVIPEETEGPYPADGSNSAAGGGPGGNGGSNTGGGTVNALGLSGIVRSDIRSSIAGATGVAAGVPLTLTIELVNTNGNCADLSGYAIYVWHCDREGRYSLYSSGVTQENYLRGVQTTASDGTVTFQTIFPACYSGRMPHIHFEIYRSTNSATSWTNKLRTSQIALPRDVCSTVYENATGYSASVQNLARITFATDNVFSDGVTTQLATMSGSVDAGYTARLQVGIAV